MNYIKAIFRTDKEYKDILKQYNYKDGISAIVFYALVMVLYYVMGVLYDEKKIIFRL